MGMFDITPEMVPAFQQRQDTQQALSAANLPAGRGGVYAASIAGNMLGRGAAGALGYQDPQMVQAQKLQMAMRDTQASGLDFNTDPTAYMTAASKNLFKYGLYDQGMQVADKVKELAQGGLAQAQTRTATRQYQQQEEAEKAIAQIMQRVGGDETAAEKLMRVHPNPLVQKRGQELGEKRYLAVGGNAFDTRTGQYLAGGTPDTELGKYQVQADNLDAQLADAKANNRPQSFIDGLQTKRDQVGDKIKLMTEGRPQSIAQERAAATLRRLQNLQDSGVTLDKTQIGEAEDAVALLERQTFVFDPVTQQQIAVKGYTIPPSITVGRGGAGPAKGLPTVGRKQLDAGSEKDLTTMGDRLSSMYNIATAFDPRYVGYGLNVVGDAVAEVSKRFGDEKAQQMAGWWQQYEQWVLDVRHDKFGATLTNNELKAFEKIRVNAGDLPGIATQNLKRQQEILNNALARRRKSLVSAGYNPAQIDALIPQPPSKAAPTAAPAKDPAFKPVPAPVPGPDVEFMTNGKVRTKYMGRDYVFPSRETYENWKRATGE